MRRCMLGWALTLTYELAEWHYRGGTIDQTEWDLYRFYWRNGAPRFSHTAEAFEIKKKGGQ